MNSTEIINAIINGDADDNLEGIVAATRERGQAKGRAVFHTVKVGDQARLKNLRPKYLIGAPVTVIGKKSTRIEVEIDPEWLLHNPQAQRFGRGPITATPQMLDVVSG